MQIQTLRVGGNPWPAPLQGVAHYVAPFILLTIDVPCCRHVQTLQTCIQDMNAASGRNPVTRRRRALHRTPCSTRLQEACARAEALKASYRPPHVDRKDAPVLVMICAWEIAAKKTAPSPAHPRYRSHRGSGGNSFFPALAVICCLCLLPPPDAHAALAPRELDALLDLKAACRSSIYKQSFLPSWSAVSFFPCTVMQTGVGPRHSCYLSSGSVYKYMIKLNCELIMGLVRHRRRYRWTGTVTSTSVLGPARTGPVQLAL